MTLGDSGYFVALARPRDGLHAVGVSWAQVIREPIVVTEYVLVETMNYLSGPADRPRGQALVRQILADSAFSVIPASEELFQRGLALHEARPDKEWSLTDCISFVVMTDMRIHRALAYDHHFVQAGFDALLRRSP